MDGSACWQAFIHLQNVTELWHSHHLFLWIRLGGQRTDLVLKSFHENVAVVKEQENVLVTTICSGARLPWIIQLYLLPVMTMHSVPQFPHVKQCCYLSIQRVVVTIKWRMNDKCLEQSLAHGRHLVNACKGPAGKWSHIYSHNLWSYQAGWFGAPGPLTLRAFCSTLLLL